MSDPHSLHSVGLHSLGQRRELPRREFLGQVAKTLTAGSIAGTLIAGCGSERKEAVDAPTASSTVPLRVAMLGSGLDAETIRRAWSAVSDQPIEVLTTESDRTEPIDASSFLDSAKRADVIIYPMATVGEAVSREIVIDFSDSDLDSIQASAGSLLVALRNATRFAGKVNAIPLGAQLPALLSTVATKPLADWAQYDQWVNDDLDGKAAEPLAAGWAGAMFLWRAATQPLGKWLFGSVYLDPVIAEEYYADVLRQIQQTAYR